MKNKKPSTLEWKDLYSAAINFKKLKPWEWMWDDDIFGVFNPENDEIGYCCVMGNAGEHFALGVYLGTEGLDKILKIQSGEILPDITETLFDHKCLMASFEDRKYIENQDYEIIRKLKLKFRGRNEWPLFRSYLPGYHPWYLNQSEAKFLTLALEQAIVICKRFKEDSKLLTPPESDQYLVRVPKKDGSKWEDEWLKPAEPEKKEIMMGKVDEDALEYLQNLKHQGVWEADFYNIPEAVQDQKDERPYYPYSILWGETESGIILNVGVAEPNQWAPVLLEKFQEIANNIQSLPQEIMVKKEELFILLKPVTSKLGIELRRVPYLKALDEVRETMGHFGDDEEELMETLMEDESIQNLLEDDAPRLDEEIIKELLMNKSIQALINERLNEEDYNTPVIVKNPYDKGNSYTGTKQTTLFDEKPTIYRFIDKTHPIMDEFQELIHGDYDNFKLKKELKQLIKKDPDFLNTYLKLFFILEEENNQVEANKILDEAYKRAVELITNEKGEWPEIMADDHIENQHIINIIYYKATNLWESGKVDKALFLLRQLIKMNPEDGIGARIIILAINMNMTTADYDKKFLVDDGYHTGMILNWFKENYHKFPHEFNNWEKEAKKLFKHVYQIRIDLKDIKPPVWRRLLVPETYSFHDLHVAILNTMGWSGSHLHEFYVKNPFANGKISIDNEKEENIYKWLRRSKASYIYDFGDMWEHEIKLEKILNRQDDVTYPICTKGKRACPPEDCGGVPGYLELLEIIKNPEHEEYEEMIEWLGGKFDPEHFNPEEVVFSDPE